VTLEGRRYPPRVRILYEDSRASTNGFGLHDFVLANVHDVTVESGRDLERFRIAKLIEAIPKNSDTKVLAALEKDAERLHAGSTVLLAWLDDDKVHRPLGLPAGQPPSALEHAILQRVPSSIRAGAVRIHLLRGNVEQLLRRIADLQPGALDEAELAAALEKAPTSRDLCFRCAAEAKHAAWRRAVRDGDPGFAETIRYLADVAARETWPPW